MVVRPKMQSVCVEKKRKRKTFMCQTGYLLRPPTSKAPEILHVGSRPGDSYIFQISWKLVESSQSCGVFENRPAPLNWPMVYWRRSWSSEFLS